MKNNWMKGNKKSFCLNKSMPGYTNASQYFYRWNRIKSWNIYVYFDNKLFATFNLSSITSTGTDFCRLSHSLSVYSKHKLSRIFVRREAKSREWNAKSMPLLSIVSILISKHYFVVFNDIFTFIFLQKHSESPRTGPMKAYLVVDEVNCRWRARQWAPSAVDWRQSDNQSRCRSPLECYPKTW